MTKAFHQKILKNDTVNIKNYPYHVAQHPNHCKIHKIQIEYLNNTTTIDEQEIAEIIK